jgi:uncharacterized membrane protein YeaQ/YmgE (transglycosylase-associated protein family)
LLVLVVNLIIAVLTGWLVPLAFKSQRPYGLAGDIVACVVSMLVLGALEWQWILPALRITGILKLVAAIGDPWGLALVVLWLMRRLTR